MCELGSLANDSVVAERPQAFVEFGIVSSDRSAFARGDVLDGMKAEHGHVGERAHRTSPVNRSQRVARVFDHDGARLPGDVSPLVEIRSVACIVYRRYGLCTSVAQPR